MSRIKESAQSDTKEEKILITTIWTAPCRPTVKVKIKITVKIMASTRK
jgi:hypothetical protein